MNDLSKHGIRIEAVVSHANRRAGHVYDLKLTWLDPQTQHLHHFQTITKSVREYQEGDLVPLLLDPHNYARYMVLPD